MWISPVDSPLSLGVSPATASPTGFFSQRFWGFISPCWNPELHGLSCSPVVPPGLSVHKCGSTWSSSHHLAMHPLCPSCLSLPLLPVWMNVSSLTPWLSDFHADQFAGSSRNFLFLNLLLSFFWLCKEAKCIYLHLHFGQKSRFVFLKLCSKKHWKPRSFSKCPTK